MLKITYLKPSAFSTPSEKKKIFDNLSRLPTAIDRIKSAPPRYNDCRRIAVKMLSTEQPNPDNSREKTMLNITHALRAEHLRRLQDKSITMLLAQWTPAVRSLPFGKGKDEISAR
ncbi:hypothetical protein RRG08_013787 [Elysia crispata]|uniref:Uncharacterized protein n=1 Tax=Elysia crispata TaxID=231223 RepID=A0AAE1ED39_9GAST|nr:hypothetical protein RRG08_013787 [Elysia crispata]